MMPRNVPGHDAHILWRALATAYGAIRETPAECRAAGNRRDMARWHRALLGDDWKIEANQRTRTSPLRRSSSEAARTSTSR